MLDLESAIKHCEEVAQEQDMKAGFETDNQTYIMSEMERKRCRECADEHWQLAEWLRELKAYKESERKKGKWIFLDECSNSGYYCSECNKKVVKEGWSNAVKKIKFCPNCGADMRGEQNG